MDSAYGIIQKMVNLRIIPLWKLTSRNLASATVKKIDFLSAFKKCWCLYKMADLIGRYEIYDLN